MKERLAYNLLMITFILYFGLPALVHADKATTKSGPLPPPARENVLVKRVPLATQDMGLKLVGTVVADDPGMSVVIIYKHATKKQGVYREGDRVGKKALIKKILRNRVIIDAGKGEAMLTMMHGQPSVSQPVRYQAARIRPPAKTVRPTGMNALMPTTYERKDVDLYFANIDALKQVHVKPLEQADGSAGFAIRRLRRGSIPWRMGLRNGDVIKGINGKAISSPDEADAFFQTLKKGGNISVEIERKSTTQELQIAVPVIPPTRSQ
jgi:general secretion pathway protein C